MVYLIMDSTERKFIHLLQPIRELAKNWDVDVASELNDYLEELDEMCITFDEGKTRLNFAEAALLIQGSACIYSKKVELLHSLVYQTLEYINNNKAKKKTNQAAESQENNEEGKVHAEEEAQFTDLEIKSSSYSQSRDSSVTVNDIPLPPECLIPQDSRSKHKLPLISVKGEILCSQKDFRLVTANPENDVILLALESVESKDQTEDHHHTAAELKVEAPQNDPAPVRADVSADGADDFLPLEENQMEVEEGAQEVEQGMKEHVERHQAPSEGRMLRERCQVEAFTPRDDNVPPVVNVWDLHDRYEALVGDKPFKSGKCYKVPDGLDDGGKRKRKSSQCQDFESWFRGNFDPPAQKLKTGPHFIDLNYIYVTTVRDKVRTKKRICRKVGIAISEEQLRQTLLQPEEAEEQRLREDPGDGFPGNLGEDNSDSEHDGFPDDIPAEFGGGPNFISPEDQKEELTYEQLVKLRVEQLVVNSRGYTQETALLRRVKDWEGKIKPVLALQEERLVFDIHDYGDRIVSAFEGVGQRRRFASVVSGFDNFEACRYLLASLQLANDYTVEIDHEVGLETHVDSMGLTLLSVHRATERFKDLHAPK